MVSGLSCHGRRRKVRSRLITHNKRGCCATEFLSTFSGVIRSRTCGPGYYQHITLLQVVTFHRAAVHFASLPLHHAYVRLDRTGNNVESPVQAVQAANTGLPGPLALITSALFVPNQDWSPWIWIFGNPEFGVAEFK